MRVTEPATRKVSEVTANTTSVICQLIASIKARLPTSTTTPLKKLGDPLHKPLADGLAVVDKTAYGIAVGVVVVVRQRVGADPIKGIPADGSHHAVGRHAGQPDHKPPKDGQDEVERREQPHDPQQVAKVNLPRTDHVVNCLAKIIGKDDIQRAAHHGADRHQDELALFPSGIGEQPAYGIAIGFGMFLHYLQSILSCNRLS